MMDFSAMEGHQDMLSPGTPDIARLRADAVPLLTQLDEREKLQSQKVIPLPAGMWNALYRLEPAGLVAKLSVGDNDFEINFLKQAAALNLKVPQVISNGRLEHPTIANPTYYLMSYIPNSANAWYIKDNGMKVQALEALAHGLGESLAKMHEIALGYITHLGTRVDTWQEAITDGFSPDWNTIAPNALFNGDLLEILRSALDKTDYLSFSDGTFVHGDLNLSNVLVDIETHRLTAIIDPAGYAGMPSFDLAYASMPWDYGFEFHRAMLAAYQAKSSKFNAALFYTSILVVAYRHERFHTEAVRESIHKEILPHLDI